MHYRLYKGTSGKMEQLKSDDRKRSTKTMSFSEVWIRHPSGCNWPDGSTAHALFDCSDNKYPYLRPHYYDFPHISFVLSIYFKYRHSGSYNSKSWENYLKKNKRKILKKKKKKKLTTFLSVSLWSFFFLISFFFLLFKCEATNVCS